MLYLSYVLYVSIQCMLKGWSWLEKIFLASVSCLKDLDNLTVILTHVKSVSTHHLPPYCSYTEKQVELFITGVATVIVTVHCWIMHLCSNIGVEVYQSMGYNSWYQLCVNADITNISIIPVIQCNVVTL